MVPLHHQGQSRLIIAASPTPTICYNTPIPNRCFRLYTSRGTMTIPIFDDIALARRTVLRRVPLDEIEISPAMLDANERIYGARLTPAEAVDRIILDVR